MFRKVIPQRIYFTQYEWFHADFLCFTMSRMYILFYLELGIKARISKFNLAMEFRD